MGIGESFGEAYSKAQMGTGLTIPKSGRAFISVRDVDRGRVLHVAEELIQLGFKLVATRGTARVLQAGGLEVDVVNKVVEGRPHIVDMIKNDEVQLIVNTTEGKQAIKDSTSIRRSAENRSVYCTTTLAGGEAVCVALRFGSNHQVKHLQELHGGLK